MKKSLLFAIGLLMCVGAIMYFKKDQLPITAQPGYKIEKAPSNEEGEDGMEEAMEQEIAKTKDPRTQEVPTERLIQARAFQESQVGQMLSSRANASVDGINWQERGPSNVGGRTRVALFDLNDAANGYKKVWAAGVGGGLWYTLDITAATPVWNKVDDFFDNIAITSMVQNPSNPQEMYFGTGEGWFNSDAIKGLGIWKSTNGGITWSKLVSTASFAFVNDLLFDNNGNLYASVRQNVGTDASGIQKTTDGGTSWTQVLGSPVFGSSARGADLELASNGDIYATLGTTGSTGGIYISDAAANATNTGNAGTWVNITPNATGVISNPAGLWQRIELACAPSDANIVYALFQGSGSNFCTSIQQYNKSTNSWAVKTVPNTNSQGTLTPFSSAQAWYNLIAAVDPNNAAVLYVGGLDALRSDNSGATWTQMTAWSLANVSGFTSAQNVHADQHGIIYAPGSSSRALWATDGGVFYTANANVATPTKPTFVNKNNGYNVTQYYAVAAHPTNSNYYLAGAQDNGSHKFTLSGINSITTVTGGDGGFCHIDQDNPNIQITSYVNNQYYVSLDGGATFASKNFGTTGGFINPTDYDDAGNKLYAGSSAGAYLRWNDPTSAGNSTSTVTVSSFSTGSVTNVTVSPLSANRVYFGLNNGSVVRVDDAHNGTSKTGTIIKTGIGSVSSVSIDPANEDHMLVTYSNYGVVSIFESNNATQASPTWTAVEGNLPDMPVRWAMFDPRNSDWALVATELGVWSTNDLAGGSTDWQSTNSGLANVRVDMLQYRASDRTIVAATHGRGLFTAVVPPITTPDINFSTGTVAMAEQNAAIIGCRRYKDYSISLYIANAPIGDATVTLTIKPGGTAVQGIDYDFTTNGDFVTPSNTLVFSNGATASKTISIRIYDDAEVKADRSFTLTYSISGSTTAQAGTGFQQETVIIGDNDSAPSLPTSANYTVGRSDFYLGSTTAFSPFDAKLQSNRTQALYRANELTALGITKGNINSIGFFVTKGSTRAYQNLQIKMGLTNANLIFDGTSVANLSTSTVKSLASFTMAAGTVWNNFILDNPFYWDGTSNLVVEICYDNGTADASNFVDRVIGYQDGSASNQGNAIIQNNISCGSSFTSPTYYSSGLKPTIQLNTTSTGTLIASALNTSTTEYFTSNKDLYYYSASGEVMARIRNLSAHNYGCSQLLIDRAGTSAVAFNNNVAANALMSKTFQVIPTTNNASGQYELTLYFTDAEKTGWEAATGQTWNNIQLVKVPSQIKNYSPTTPSPDGPGAVQAVVPVRGTFNGGYTLTYTFDNGFSGFGAGIVGSALPVTLLTFKGTNNGTDNVLEWSTSSEQNSKFFDIQKSSDGVNYHSIGKVNAAGISTIVRNYNFKDRQVNEVNYYRLQMMDADGRSKTSDVVLLRNKNTVQKMWVANNPFYSSVDLRFAKTPLMKVMIEMTDLSGKEIYKKEYNASDHIKIDLSGKMLSQGVYLLKATVDGKVFTSKLIKQ